MEGEHDWTLEGDTVANRVAAQLNVRPSNRLSLSVAGEYTALDDDLQYVTTAQTSDGPRWVLGRIDQDVWNLTVRVNLAITPDLTLQYYGSPFVATGRYTALRRATDTLASAYENRFHRYGSDEIAYSAAANAYDVREADGRRALLLRKPRLQLPPVPLQPRRPLGVQAGLDALRRLVTGPHQRRAVLGRRVPDELGRAVERAGRQRLPRQAELLVLAVTGGESTWRSRAAARPTAGTPLPADA